MFWLPGFATSLGYGAASEFLRRSTTSTNSTESPSLLIMRDVRGKSDAPRIQAHADARRGAESRAVP